MEVELRFHNAPCWGALSRGIFLYSALADLDLVGAVLASFSARYPLGLARDYWQVCCMDCCWILYLRQSAAVFHNPLSSCMSSFACASVSACLMPLLTCTSKINHANRPYQGQHNIQDKLWN